MAAATTKKAYQLFSPDRMLNSLLTKMSVPTKPMNTPRIFIHLKVDLKNKKPRIRVNNGVIPFRTAATELSITVSAKANK